MNFRVLSLAASLFLVAVAPAQTVGPVSESLGRRSRVIGNPAVSIFAPKPLGLVLRSILKRNIPAKRKNEIVPGYVLVKFPTKVAAELTKTEATRARFVPTGLRSENFRNRIQRSGWTVWQLGKGEDPKAVAASLKGKPNVVAAQPLNKIYPLLPEPNDGDWNVIEIGEPMIPLGEGVTYRRLWYLDETSAFDAWNDWPNRWFTSADKPQNVPMIAVIDTGVERQHPDFINAGGFDSSIEEGGQFDLSLDAQFSFGEVLQEGSTEDAMGHGTHVTGLALASGNNGNWNGKGIVGLGYPSKGINLRVFDDTGNGSDADAAGAIFYATDHGVDIINLSLGTENFSQLFQDAVTYAWQKGVLVVVACNEDGAGGGDLGPIYPAACSGAFAVTANGYGYIHASDYYAGTGSYIDLAAPGGNIILDYSNIEDPIAMLAYIYSTTMTTHNPIMDVGAPGYDLGYGYLIGTSMASPIVAGAASLYYGKNDMDRAQGMQNLRAYRALQRSALSVYGAPKGSWETHQGYGSLDAYYLLQDADSRGATAGAIEGIVYNEGTAQGNATVRAKKDGGTITYQTSTLANGTYRYDQLAPGMYTVTAVAFGKTKVRRVEVISGSDAPATDFWCGTYTGDDTAPIVDRFAFSNWEGVPTGGAYSATRFKLWAYDTETGIEKYQIKIGRTAGAGDVVANTEIAPTSNEVVLNHAAITPSAKLYATLTVTNGNGTTTTISVPMSVNTEWDAAFVSQQVPNTVAPGQVFTVAFTFRNAGTQNWTSADVQRLALTSMPVGSTTFGKSRLGMPPGSNVAPGQTITVQARLTAPNTVGLYQSCWKFTRGTVQFGSASTSVWVTVQ